jgi:hypothetical protein
MFYRRSVDLISYTVFASGVGIVFLQTKESNCAEEKTMNSAFVFIKPHANTIKTQQVVKSTLESKGIKIRSHGELTAQQINSDMLIDQHYYAIGMISLYLLCLSPYSIFIDFYSIQGYTFKA